MASRENSSDLPPFWEQKGGFYFNVLTNFGVKERPEKVLGGILADDMGLVSQTRCLFSLVIMLCWHSVIFLLMFFRAKPSPPLL